MGQRTPGRQAGWLVHIDQQSAWRAGNNTAVDGPATDTPWHAAGRHTLFRTSPECDAERRNTLWRNACRLALNATRSGGTPYGATHVAYEQTATELTVEEAAIAQTLGRRVADIAVRLGGQP